MASGEYSFSSGRDTFESVFRKGIGGAKHSIALATANVKDVRVPSISGKRAKSVVQVLRDKARAGVKVRLLHSGVPSGSFIESFKRLNLGEEKNFVMRRCPRVHFKCAIIDHEWAYLGSANLTGAGMGAKSEKRRNFEAGVVTSDSYVVRHLDEMFDSVFSGAMCDDCDRKNICYVPLEEPDF